MASVRDFGEAHDIAALQYTFSPCDEGLAWALAAISLRLLDAQAVYRIVNPKNDLFVLLFELTKLPQDTAK
jgi:hypothetical protein